MNRVNSFIGAGAALAVSLSAWAGVSLSGSLALRGFVSGQFGPDNPSGEGQSSFLSYAVGSQGGSGSGSTGGGVGRAAMDIYLMQTTTTTRLRALGFARHDFDASTGGSTHQEFSAIGTANATGEWSAMQFTVTEDVRFTIENRTEAYVETLFGSGGEWSPVDPAYLSSVGTGSITYDEGSTVSGIMTAGTYSLDLWIGAFGFDNDGIADAIRPGWQAATGSNFRRVSASLADWSLTMTVVPAPGAAGLLLVAFGNPSRRRRT